MYVYTSTVGVQPQVPRTTLQDAGPCGAWADGPRDVQRGCEPIGILCFHCGVGGSGMVTVDAPQGLTPALCVAVFFHFTGMVPHSGLWLGLGRLLIAIGGEIKVPSDSVSGIGEWNSHSFLFTVTRFMCCHSSLAAIAPWFFMFLCREAAPF